MHTYTARYVNITSGFVQTIGSFATHEEALSALQMRIEDECEEIISRHDNGFISRLFGDVYSYEILRGSNVNENDPTSYSVVSWGLDNTTPPVGDDLRRHRTHFKGTTSEIREQIEEYWNEEGNRFFYSPTGAVIIFQSGTILIYSFEVFEGLYDLYLWDRTMPLAHSFKNIEDAASYVATRYDEEIYMNSNAPDSFVGIDKRGKIARYHIKPA